MGLVSKERQAYQYFQRSPDCFSLFAPKTRSVHRVFPVFAEHSPSAILRSAQALIVYTSLLLDYKTSLFNCLSV